MKLLADASLPGLDSAFPKPFILTRYHNHEELLRFIPDQDILLCRSTLQVDASLLENARLHSVATASSGSDHLDHAYLKQRGIQVIDAKGSNASAVADYMMACIAWLEQTKHLKGKRAGVIGMGKVGYKVHKRLQALGFQLRAFDPPKALDDNQFTSDSLASLYDCDLLCIHAELHQNPPYPSINLINKAFLDQLKPGCVLINAARGGIIDEEALITHTTPLIYCTDVYLNEPAINSRLIQMATLCTPHIAGHSLEAKYAAVALISEQLHQQAGIPIPTFAHPPFSHSPPLNEQEAWQDLVLSIYNPENETVLLKHAHDKQSAFLSLRKKHNTRHDFSLYLSSMKQAEFCELFRL